MDNGLTRCGLIELPVPANVVTEVAAGEQVHDEVEVLPVLEGVVHVDEEGVVLQLGQDAPLAHHGLHASLGQDPSLAHLLHGEHLWVLGPLVLDLPNLTEAALSNALLVLEQVLAHS